MVQAFPQEEEENKLNSLNTISDKKMSWLVICLFIK